jgi:site-specific DNA-methyltransferase (adenine-specific)
MEIFADIPQATLYRGDCLDILPTLGPVDAVIIDPPYSSGARTAAEIRGRSGMQRGQRWKPKPLHNDRMTTTGFLWTMRHVASFCYDLLPDGGSFLSFIDWRQYPQLYAVLESVNFGIQTLVVWDKRDMGLGNGFRNQHELIIHASKGTPTIYDRGTANVLQCKRLQQSEDHAAEKPQALLEALLRVITKEGDTVLDPMMGSGTTGAAAVQLGRRFIGIEKQPPDFETAKRKISQHQTALAI